MKKFARQVVLNIVALWIIVTGHHQVQNHKMMMADYEIGNIGDFRD